MSVFDTASKKIHNLLGMTSLGQKTMANSVGVVLASDESTLPVSVAAGSDVTEGNTSDAAVITDTTGTLSGKLRGLVKWAFERMPASLGQKTKANSLGVALASDQDALPVTDNSTTLSVDDGAGSLTVDSPGLPNTLGQKTMANSLGMVLASDQSAIPVTDNATTLSVDDGAGSLTVDSPGIPTTLGQKTMANSLGVTLASDQDPIGTLEKIVYSYGVVYGEAATRYLGTTSDWAAIRNSTEAAATDTLDSDANCAKYFDADDAAFNADPIWIYIPVMAGGFRKFKVTIHNGLGVDLAVTLYAVGKNQTWALGGGSKLSVQDKIGYHQIANETLTTGSVGIYGPGGAFPASAEGWPIPYLLIKADPASDPAAEKYWSLYVEREGSEIVSFT